MCRNNADKCYLLVYFINSQYLNPRPSCYVVVPTLHIGGVSCVIVQQDINTYSYIRLSFFQIITRKADLNTLEALY
jgi:hypothetical protein